MAHASTTLLEPTHLSADSIFVPLEALMIQRKPLDLSNAVTLEADTPVDCGGYGQVRLGRLNGELVGQIQLLFFQF
jgi:hypothetical protein